MTCKDIKQLVDKEAGFDIQIDNRKNQSVYYRWIYYYFCKKYLALESDENIGKEVKRDRNTVRNGITQINHMLAYENRTDISYIIKIIDDKINNVTKNNNLDIYECRERLSELQFKYDSLLATLKEKRSNEIFHTLQNMSPELLRQFEETRLKPFLIMNKIQKQ